jgi:hypothetical protein
MKDASRKLTTFVVILLALTLAISAVGQTADELSICRAQHAIIVASKYAGANYVAMINHYFPVNPDSSQLTFDAVEHMQAYPELMPDALDAQAARDQVMIWQEKAKQ